MAKKSIPTDKRTTKQDFAVAFKEWNVIPPSDLKLFRDQLELRLGRQATLDEFTHAWEEYCQSCAVVATPRPVGILVANQLLLFDSNLEKASKSVTIPSWWDLFSLCLPPKTKREVYEPAYNDMLRMYLEARRNHPTRPRWVTFCFTLQTLWMVIDCVRCILQDVFRAAVATFLPVEKLTEWFRQWLR